MRSNVIAILLSKVVNVFLCGYMRTVTPTTNEFLKLKRHTERHTRNGMRENPKISDPTTHIDFYINCSTLTHTHSSASAPLWQLTSAVTDRISEKDCINSSSSNDSGSMLLLCRSNCVQSETHTYSITNLMWTTNAADDGRTKIDKYIQSSQGERKKIMFYRMLWRWMDEYAQHSHTHKVHAAQTQAARDSHAYSSSPNE